MKIWFDGALRELDEARLSPLDRGVTVGDGIFETMRVYAGQPFAWTRHYARLTASGDALGLSIPTLSDLQLAATSVLRANELTDARLRITVTGGEGPPGSSRVGAVAHAWIVAWPFEARTGSVDVVIAPWTRNQHSALAGLKTISYASNVRALGFAEAQGAAEALFANTVGNLCEATGSNVFIGRNERLVTPPLSAGCLAGVTRGLIIELAAGLGMECDETDVPINEVAEADEAFLSSTTREAQPIGRVDGVALRTAPGPLTIAIADAFSALVERNLDP